MVLKPAIKEAALTCEKGQYFDFIDGGTCWTCPDDSRRSVFSVKTAKACEYKSFVWATPQRDMPGLFGLGKGAEEMAAQLIASRTEIDAAIERAAKKTGLDVETVSKAVWKLIDEEPWNSAPLHAVMLEQVAIAAKKPVAQRTAAEKGFISNLEQYIQWNRQFIAYQSKQAHETWKTATAAVLAERGKDNLVALYGGVITPPDFSGIVASSISGSAGVGMMTGAYLSGFVAGKFAFIAPYTAQLAEKAAGAAVGTYITTGGNAASRLLSAASGPVGVAVSVVIISAMELDKFVKLDVAESKINQAVELSNLPVDLNVFLQQKDGEEQLGYHWSLLTSASTKPSAGFKARIAALKGGTAGSDDRPMPTIIGGTLLGTTQTAAAAPAEPPTASKAQTTAYIKMNQQTAETIRFELSAAPGLCVSKLHKHSQGLALRDCADKGTMWIQPNTRNNTLVFAQRYCIVVDGSKADDQVPVLVTDCQAPSNAKNWQLTREGMVQSLRSKFCMAVSGAPAMDAPIVLQRCDNTKGQVWRPWTATN
ncbi:MAG: RICIN domain-containing protein [Alphaproteobacteria bacterium]|nr:RICIN domain-containing protein [Alphaproteobacteria bacterium]